MTASALRAPALLRSMVDEGGHAVQTEHAGRICARTLIQLDGDVLTFIDPAHLDDEALLERHFERVAAVVAELKLVGSNLAKGLQVLMWAGPVSEVAMLTRSALADGAFSWGEALWQGGYGVGPALLTATGVGVRLYVRRKLKRGIRKGVRKTLRHGAKAAARRVAAAFKGG